MSGTKEHPGDTGTPRSSSLLEGRIRRWLAWPFYIVGTAVIDVADWLDSEGWWTR